MQQASVLMEHGHRIIYVGRMGLFENFAGVAGRATETFHRGFVTLHGVCETNDEWSDDLCLKMKEISCHFCFETDPRRT
jgi:hypothetical protein